MNWQGNEGRWSNWANEQGMTSGADRDSAIKYSLAEIGRERRGGYGWYTDRPRSLRETDYPRWAAKWLPNR
jgi:pectinesterase